MFGSRSDGSAGGLTRRVDQDVILGARALLRHRERATPVPGRHAPSAAAAKVWVLHAAEVQVLRVARLVRREPERVAPVRLLGRRHPRDARYHFTDAASGGFAKIRKRLLGGLNFRGKL